MAIGETTHASHTTLHITYQHGATTTDAAKTNVLPLSMINKKKRHREENKNDFIPSQSKIRP